MTELSRSATALAIAMFLAVPSAAREQGIDTQRSTITVRVFKSGLFRALADNHVIQAFVTEGSIDDSAPPRVNLSVDVQTMRVLDPGLSQKDRDDVRARMLGPDVLDATRFAQIRFRSTAVQPIAGNRFTVRGELDLHGQTRPITIDVVREGDRFKGETKLRQSDYAITPISLAGGTVKVKDEVSIEFEIVAR